MKGHLIVSYQFLKYFKNLCTLSNIFSVQGEKVIPTIVHCSAGNAQTGAFIGTYFYTVALTLNLF